MTEILAAARRLGLLGGVKYASPQQHERRRCDRQGCDDVHHTLRDPQNARQNRREHRGQWVLNGADPDVPGGLRAARQRELLDMPEHEEALECEVQAEREHVGDRDHDLDRDAEQPVEQHRQTQVDDPDDRARNRVPERGPGELMIEQRPHPLHGTIVAQLCRDA
jgi:hypothetical protein